MADAISKRATVTIHLPPDTELPPALGANFFHFSAVGTEVQLLIGSFNLLQVVERQLEPGQLPPVVVPQISHRFTLSTLGFEQLRTQVERIATSIQPSGVELTPTKKP